MSIECREIGFSIKNDKMAETINNYSSKRKKADCKLDIQGDTVEGLYYSSEYDERIDDWEPAQTVPSNSNAIKWLLDVMHHGTLITKAGIKEIKDNIDIYDESLQEYEITHYKCSPQGLNYVFFQKYDGDKICTYGMNSYNWECMWDSKNKDMAKAIFEKHGYIMDDYEISTSFIGDTFDYLKDKPIFKELMEIFADKKEEEKISGDETELLKAEINELLDEIGQWVVSPETITYKGAKIDTSTYRGSMLKPFVEWGDKMKLQYFVDSSISQLGGTASSGIGATTDITVLIRKYEDYSKDHDICKYYNIDALEKVTFVWGQDEPEREKRLTEKEYYFGKLVVFKNYLKDFLERLNQNNTKRTAKKTPKPPIKVVFEDQWFNYLIELDQDNEFHNSRQVIAKSLIDSSPFAARSAAIYSAQPEGRDFEL